MKKSNLVLWSLLLSVVLAGCEAHPIAPERNELSAPTVRTFPLKRLRLNLNTLFLWKLDGMPADDAAKTVSRVLELARRKTELDDLRPELEDRAQAVADRKVALEQKRREANQAALKLNQELKKIDQEIADLKANANSDEKLVTERTALRTQKATERDVKLAEKAAAEKELEPLDAELQPITHEIGKIQAEGASVVGELVKTVSWFDPQPESIAIEPTEGESLSRVEIRKWGVREGDGGRSFTSEASEIRDLSYEPKGGILRFKVVLNLNDPDAEYYTFNLARSKYAETDKSGKAYYSGDLVRHVRGPDGADAITKGAAELAGIETN